MWEEMSADIMDTCSLVRVSCVISSDGECEALMPDTWDSELFYPPPSSSTVKTPIERRAMLCEMIDWYLRSRFALASSWF